MTLDDRVGRVDERGLRLLQGVHKTSMRPDTHRPPRSVRTIRGRRALSTHESTATVRVVVVNSSASAKLPGDGP